MSKNNNSYESCDFKEKLIEAALKLYGSSNIPYNQIDYIFEVIQGLFKIEHGNIKKKVTM